MDMITVSAKTLDEAITNALIELQTTSDHLHYEVIQKESSGFLGFLGAKPCIIRAGIKHEEEEKSFHKPVEKPEVKQTAKPTEVKNEKKPDARMERQAEKPAAKNFEKKDFVRKESRREFDKKKEQPMREESPAAEAAAIPAPKAKQPVNVDVEKVQRDAKEFLTQVFGAMGMTVAIETAFDETEGELQVMMEGEDMGILIGKRGQTLDSLQYLVSLVVNKETEGYLRVKLDTENYRERRKETLETLAKNISYKVKRTKYPVSLEPMNPYERRIIHSALQNDRYVTTRSEGEDPYRHVVIALKKENYGNGGRRDRYPAHRDNRNRDRRAGDRTAEHGFERGREYGAERNMQRGAEKYTRRYTEKPVETAPEHQAE